MESLRKVNAKINLENVSSDINSSLPARNLNEMSDDCRDRLFNYTNPQAALDAINEDAVLSLLKRLKKNRSPGIDGFTIEHLISLMLGGNRDVQLRSELIKGMSV